MIRCDFASCGVFNQVDLNFCYHLIAHKAVHDKSCFEQCIDHQDLLLELYVFFPPIDIEILKLLASVTENKPMAIAMH